MILQEIFVLGESIQETKSVKLFSGKASLILFIQKSFVKTPNVEYELGFMEINNVKNEVVLRASLLKNKSFHVIFVF